MFQGKRRWVRLNVVDQNPAVSNFYAGSFFHGETSKEYQNSTPLPSSKMLGSFLACWSPWESRGYCILTLGQTSPKLMQASLTWGHRPPPCITNFFVPDSGGPARSPISEKNPSGHPGGWCGKTMHFFTKRPGRRGHFHPSKTQSLTLIFGKPVIHCPCSPPGGRPVWNPRKIWPQIWGKKTKKWLPAFPAPSAPGHFSGFFCPLPPGRRSLPPGQTSLSEKNSGRSASECMVGPSQKNVVPSSFTMWKNVVSVIESYCVVKNSSGK